jgi:hypothetical protein
MLRHAYHILVLTMAELYLHACYHSYLHTFDHSYLHACYHSYLHTFYHSIGLHLSCWVITYRACACDGWAGNLYFLTPAYEFL